MSILDAIALFVAAVGAGALNSVAGGGSFLTFPTLLFQGVPAVTANATSTVALWPGSLASAGAYRKNLTSASRHFVSFSVVSVIGGYLGARLLLLTPDEDFRAAVPWLLLFATMVFAFGGTVVQRLRGARPRPTGPPSRLSTAVAVSTQLVIAVYGGFFGGGIGIMMLAAFTVLGMQDIHAMNGMKNWLAVCINGVAVLTFVVAGEVQWGPAGVMLFGAVLGGYGGATGAQRLDPLLVRRFVIALGFVLTAYFFVTG